MQPKKQLKAYSRVALFGGFTTAQLSWGVFVVSTQMT